MGHIANLVGEKFDLLRVLRFLRLDKDRGAIWECRCRCGNFTEASTRDLRYGDKKSCNCLRYTSKNKTHGFSKTPEYRVWKGMRARCKNPNCSCYPNYGGRGIEVCAKWDSSFPAFLHDMGARPSARHRIERLDNNGNYAPGNCCWATSKEQNQNKRNVPVYEAHGQQKTLPQWAAESGVRLNTLHYRLAHGWELSEALETKPGHSFSPPVPRYTKSRPPRSHGKTNTPEYKTWHGMRTRCLNKRDKSYRRYGAKGITICDRWRLLPGGFEHFLEDMGPKPSPAHSIDRIDSRGNYCPENCRWATPLEQARNRKCVKRVLHEGRTLCLTEWAEQQGIEYNTLLSRLRAGWTFADSIKF